MSRPPRSHVLPDDTYIGTSRNLHIKRSGFSCSPFRPSFKLRQAILALCQREEHLGGDHPNGIMLLCLFFRVGLLSV